MKKLLKTRLLAGVILVSVFALFTQCNEQMAQEEASGLQFGVQSGPTGGLDKDTQKKFENGFENNVHPLLRSSKYGCVNCHGANQVPRHGHADPGTAKRELDAASLIDYENPELSRIIIKVGVEEHNCAPNCAELASNLSEMISEWVSILDESGENPSGGGGNEPPANVRCEPTVNPLLVEIGGGGSNGTGLTRRQAFDETVFPYMSLSSGCAGCHNSGRRPFHSAADANIQYAAWENSELADFNNVDNSFIMQKIAGGHQGFNMGSEVYGGMRAAIIAWRDRIDPNAGQDETIVTYNRQWDSCESVDEAIPSMAPINEGEDEEGEVRVTGGLFTINQARISGANNTFRIVDDYITNPNTFNGPLQPTVNGNSVGKLEYDFEVVQAGNIEVVLNVSSAAANDGGSDSFFVAIAPRGQAPADNANTYAEFHFRSNNGQFSDEIVRDRSMGDANRVWTLPAGSYTLVIKERENQARVRNVAVRAVGEEATPVTTNPFKVMEFDIGAQVGKPGAKLTFNLEDFTDESYKISNVKIVGGQFIYVRRMRILINDIYIPSNATYLLVDHLVTTDDEEISDSSMTMLKINGPDVTTVVDEETGEETEIPADRLSVEFDVLVLTEDAE